MEVIFLTHKRNEILGRRLLDALLSTLQTSHIWTPVGCKATVDAHGICIKYPRCTYFIGTLTGIHILRGLLQLLIFTGGAMRKPEV